MNKNLRTHLLGTACTSVLALAAFPALAQEVSVTNANALITANQSNTPSTAMSIISTNGTLDTSFVGVLTDTVTGSTVNTLNNTVASSVLGNEAVLGILSTVNTEVAGGTGADVTAAQAYDAADGFRADALADANLAIGVVQGNRDVTSSATTANTVASVNDGAVGTSTIDVTGNAQRASGALSLAQTSINTTANSSNMTAGIATSQVNADSSLTLTSASLAGIRVGDANTEGATDSTLTLSGNSQAAFGAGNSATNGLTATVSNATLTPVVGSAVSTTDADGGAGTNAAGTANADATFAIGNAQTQEGGALSAITDGVGRGFELIVAGPVATSTLTNDSNTASSSIRGNEATNTATLAMTNVVTGAVATPAPGTVAAIANSQNIDGTVAATTMGAAGLAMETAIGATLADSTVSTSGNAVTAAATANTGSNRMVVTANGLNTGLTATPSAVVPFSIFTGDQTATATAAFAATNAQQAQGSVTASLVNNATTPTFGARIQTSVTGNITESTIASDLNTLSATATGNEITAAGNAINISGANVQTTTALANSQGLLADVSAVIGTPAVAAVAPSTFTAAPFTITGSGSSVIATPTDLSLAQGQALAAQIAAIDSSLTAAYDAVADTITVNRTGGGALTATPTAFTYGGSPASLASGGVTIAAGANITDSTLSVDGNITRGTVTGNTAANRLAVTAANITQGSALTTANANYDYATLTATAAADNALTNSQAIGNNDLTTTVSGAFAITQAATTAVDSSTLSVSGNTQMATTTGNAGVNDIALSATNMDTTSALMSQQVGLATTSATSDMQVYAPAATLDSTVDMSRNVNQAMATLNTVENRVTVSAPNIASASTGANAVLDATTLAAGDTLSATADNVLNNLQAGATSVAATANTTVVNGDGGIGFPAAFASSGIRNSTINLDANRTVAQSTVNNAVNTMALNGGAALAATGGVLNAQESSATSTATASSNVALVIGATAANEAVDSSTVSIDGNRTAAQASGNVASNALNVSALSLTGSGAGSSVLNSGISGPTSPDGTNSTYGVLNNQDNSGAVTAAVTSAVYGGIFGSTAPALSATASSLTLNGNQVAANAMGNSASNSLTLAALNYGTSSAAIANEQANSANITATITEARLVLNPVAGVGSSNLSSIGNTISSSAVGNSAVSTLIRN